MASSSSTLFVPAFTELRSDEFYNYRNTSCQLKVIRSNEYHKVYIGFHKFTSYQDTTTSETQHSHNFVNLPLVAVDELIKCLVDVGDFAKQQAGVYQLHTIVFDE